MANGPGLHGSGDRSGRSMVASSLCPACLDRTADLGRCGSALPAGAFDPEGWRDALVVTIRLATGRDREQLLESLSRLANKSTLDALRRIDGHDVADLRRRLQTVQATRLFLRTFGRMSLHRGDWNGSQINVDKKRVRMLLALLAARAHTDLSRDPCVEFLWPEADADAAINNLNQTVFQLRRYIDPDYRGGESPEYVTSTSDQISLNQDLVYTDLAELRRLPQRLDGSDWTPSPGRS